MKGRSDRTRPASEPKRPPPSPQPLSGGEGLASRRREMAVRLLGCRCASRWRMHRDTTYRSAAVQVTWNRKDRK